MDFSGEDFKKLESMGFNEVRYDPESSVLFKRSEKMGETLRNEIFWYLLLPDELSFLVPKVFSYSITNETVWVKLEYYDYKVLSEKYLNEDISVKNWKRIVTDLLDCVNQFREYKFKLNPKNYKKMYVEKTRDRVNSSIEDGFSLFEEPNIEINGESYKGWGKINKKLPDFVDLLIDSGCSTIIHGDLHLGNVLYSEKESIIKLIDPRGNWGENLIFGDFKYDLAKLRHSFHGCYNFIVNGHFQLKHTNEKIHYRIDCPSEVHKVVEYFDRKVSEVVELKKIIFIEGLLFLSMINLHNNFRKKVIMFSKGIEKLNKVLF